MEQHSILVVEDDPAVARGLRDGLEREGYLVVWKATGSEGVAYAAHGPAHLVLLDVRLPDGSGFDFCRDLRRRGLHLPVIILTAQSDETDKVLGLEMGADDYITKPFSLRELVSRVRAQLRRAYGEFAGGGAGVYLLADLVLDPARTLVLRGDQSLNLTPTEFRLLHYLAQNRGRALTREQIIEAVWGHAADLESEKAVNVHIRRLREKIELDPAQPALILTVPGVGYRLSG
jgi:two-component system alkaline phosphatase synthesis response regulator PhoP